MRVKYLIFIFPLFLALFFLIPASPTHAAFGISPPFLNADHLVPGAKYQQTVYLVQDQPNQDLNIQANLTMPQPGASWISLDKGFNFVIPQGVRQFPVTITVSVPSNVTLGAYSGNLTFTTQPSSAGQVTIALGAQVAINLTIGTGTFEKYSVPLIQFPDILEGQSPTVHVKFQNDGNVPESFDGATYQLYDQYDSVQLAYIQKSSGFPTTAPFTIADYNLTFPLDFYLGVGEYWGVVNFYKNGQVVASQKAIFNVLKATWYQEAWNYIMDEWVYFLIGLVLVLIVIALAIWRSKRK
ncbi:MAG TPA: hypothetical protein VIJ29_03215 [Candidatus Paceibacterota bacterium]